MKKNNVVIDNIDYKTINCVRSVVKILTNTEKLTKPMSIELYNNMKYQIMTQIRNNFGEETKTKDDIVYNIMRPSLSIYIDIDTKNEVMKNSIMVNMVMNYGIIHKV